MDIHNLIGYVAGAINFGGLGFYLHGIYRGQPPVRPQRITWFLWTIIGAIIAYEHRAVGGFSTFWLALSTFVGPLIVSLCAIRRGQGGASRIDFVTAALCFVCLVLRLTAVTDDCQTLLLILIADTFAGVPTFIEYFQAPDRSALRGWTTGFVGAAINLFAIKQLKFWVMLQPFHLFGMHLIAILLLTRRRVPMVAVVSNLHDG